MNYPHKITREEQQRNLYYMLLDLKGDRNQGLHKPMSYYFKKHHVGKLKSALFDGIEKQTITFDFVANFQKKLNDYNNQKPVSKEVCDAISLLEANGYSVTKRAM